MGNKLISMVLVACLVLLPVQIFAYGGNGDGDGDDSFTSSADIGVGGPPLTFTPPENMELNIPDSYTNPGVAGSTTVFPDSDVRRATQENEMNSGFLHRAKGHVYDALATVGEGAVIAGKVAVKGLAVAGTTAGVLAAIPGAAVGAAGTVAALGVVAVVCGGAALVGGALMQGAETYGDGIDKGKSQTDAATDGLTSGLAKGVIDTAIDLTPGLGTVDLIEKARTGGKGVGDQIHGGGYEG
ncbi:MAG: hypothetical protein JRC99_10535 [Deltaproteobacteria bacterium]|nr:hypothetical protein [Deltaproteobacteria bacterium]